MNKKILALFLCCALVFGMVPAALSTAFSSGSDFTIYGSNGAPTDSVMLPQNDKTTLTAVAATGSGRYQWQIRVSDTVWANIVGSTGTTLELSYAMVANLLRGNSVDIRCKLTNGVNNVTYSNIVAVTVTAETPSFSAKRAPAAPTVISGAEPIGEPIISGTPEFLPISEPAPAVEEEDGFAADFLTEEELPADGDTGSDGDNGGSTNEEPTVPSNYTIEIKYVFADDTQAAPSWTASVSVGSTYQQEVKSPDVLGYTPDKPSVQVNASEVTIYTVIYYPAEVDFTVKHWQQNVKNDEYDLVDTETKKGYTEAAVGESLAKTYEGFYSLLYDTTTTIAADGSTEVNVYYDRYYYLMSFDLDGGYGVEPIYARYGAQISVGEPTKPGYTFTDWDKEIPATMPAKNETYRAQWQAGTSGFTVVFWYENADDNGYSVAGTYEPVDVAPGTEKKSDDYKNQSFDGRDDTHFTYNAAKAETVTVSGDGSTVLNVYFTRNTYTLTFRELNCNIWWQHTHSDSCYKQVATISAKYGADISGEFKKAPFTTTYNGRAWECTESSKYDYALQTLDRMPGFDATFNLYDKSSNTKKTIYYYVQKVGTTVNATQWPSNASSFDLLKQVDTYFNYATYEEEYHEIQGFTRYSAGVAGFRNNSKNFSNNRLNLYYMRNSYTLKFYNHDTYIDGNQTTVQYEAPLKDYYFEPEYPSSLEPNAYVFAGWYTTAGCYEGSEADLSTMTMPASDVILYAKWTPKTHMVRTYLTKDEMDNGAAALGTWDRVPHGTPVKDTPEAPKNGQYTFVGWFYISDAGEEKAFDFSMPVNRDLNLYAKWSSNTLMQYTIYYQLENGEEIAPPTKGSALAGTTKTFEAKTGTQLNEGYQSGYFPKTSSHSLTIDIEGTDENKKNEFIFVYVPKQEVNYTVRYLEKDTMAVLHEEKHAATSDAVITEKFEQINGYAPDAYQKRLVLSADEAQNVITFWYVKDDAHAPVQIIHWTQNIEGDGYTEYQSSTNLNGIIGNEYAEQPLRIRGFQYNEYNSKASGTLTAGGLVLNLYYDRIEYPYEFRFLENGTDNELAKPVVGNARYGTQVKQNAKTIPGYKLVSGASEIMAFRIDIENPAGVASNNVRTFYYVEDTVDIKYEVVGPTGSGELDNYQDNGIGVLSGESLKGSAPTAADGFKFVGWFKDEDCTQPVVSTWVDASKKLTPGKTKDYGTEEEQVMGYEAATYYAKFEYDVADLTIQKTGCENIDENQSFLFDVTGPNGYSTRVAIKGNGSVTIKGLKIGEYTVTEVTSWSWRYTPEMSSQKITLQPANTNAVNFVNSRSNQKWLGGDAYSKNDFKGTN